MENKAGSEGIEIEELEDGFSPPWPESCDGALCERFFGRNYEQQVEVMRDKRYYCMFSPSSSSTFLQGVLSIVLIWMR